MKLIVLSSPSTIPNEPKLINSMLEEGLEMFHVHKPLFSKAEIEKFIQQIDSKFHDRVYIHSFFPKFHSLDELKGYRPSSTGQLGFLSPIFDSITKEGYKSNFSERMHRFIQLKPELMAAIKGKKIIALGGVDEDKIDLLRRVGFAGAAVCGAIWSNANPMSKFLRIRDICDSKAFLRRELFLGESKQITPGTRPDRSA